VTVHDLDLQDSGGVSKKGKITQKEGKKKKDKQREKTKKKGQPQPGANILGVVDSLAGELALLVLNVNVRDVLRGAVRDGIGLCGLGALVHDPRVDGLLCDLRREIERADHARVLERRRGRRRQQSQQSQQDQCCLGHDYFLNGSPDKKSRSCIASVGGRCNRRRRWYLTGMVPAFVRLTVQLQSRVPIGQGGGGGGMSTSKVPRAMRRVIVVLFELEPETQRVESAADQGERLCTARWSHVEQCTPESLAYDQLIYLYFLVFS